MICGLLGEKLSHSYSPEIHRHLADYSYELFEKSPDMLDNFFQSKAFIGLNVTIPYKKTVVPYCNQISDCARQLGAVNTIVKTPDGKLIGHNTDYFGFLYMVKRSGLQVSGKKVLVLGSGGASVTVVAVLQELGAVPVIISRSGKDNYGNLNLHADASVIVNTTPVGMYPNTGVSPVNLDLFPLLEGVLDLIYNPERTRLILDAEKRNIKTENGLSMLVAQAWESAQWFTNKQLPENLITKIHHQLRKKMENTILIGMPGSGKSTIGKLLAEKNDKVFVDADTKIIEKAGMSIPDIFAKYGESGFRTFETEVLSELGKQSGLVIATGGGCVTRVENFPLLHQNGSIIWLQRSIDLLPKDGRPLSQTGSLHEMYRNRKSLYEHFADYVIDNNGSPEETLSQILNTEVIT